MDPILAQIIMFAGNFAPRGWAFCDGQLLPIASNQALFSLLGTTYGGDGTTTFGLPDLRSRVPIHPGTGPGLSTYRWGQRGGVETVTLTLPQIPSHNHLAQSTVTAGSATATMNASSAGTTNVPTGAYPAQPGNIGPSQINTYSSSKDTTMAADAIAVNVSGMGVATTVVNNGGSQFHTNIQPFVCVNYIIALVGTFPSRS
ncbi:phage tail protein [Flavobacterium sp. K5-23]|uniref:phage tail protein n=1 Tax=Flavobacterium sp. K5-23 TaxID=2746225 RepID=UPI00201096E7|nr:tail fiber protein [Flavobacterium sp. K5-23]UQD56218.1 phage tail protein [Flavobacterium sp. K5-23]